ncbi:MAG TPA: 30S ribosome-binding factor RbfA [Longimicrobiales bacterium]|jgi:ribosome-binding factor A
MPNRRQARLNEQLKREISDLLQTSLRDPRVGPVTVTGVRVSPDLDFARVFVRPRCTGEERAEALDALQAAAPFVRRSLGRELHLRRIPELRFLLDETLETAQRIEQILDDVRPQGGWPAEPDTDEGDGEGATS